MNRAARESRRMKTFDKLYEPRLFPKSTPTETTSRNVSGLSVNGQPKEIYQIEPQAQSQSYSVPKVGRTSASTLNSVQSRDSSIDTLEGTSQMEVALRIDNDIHPELLELLQITDPVTVITPANPFQKNSTVGLINLGNTCYMNSILQCLMAIKPLISVVLSDRNKKGNVSKVFSGFVEQFIGKQYGTV